MKLFVDLEGTVIDDIVSRKMLWKNIDKIIVFCHANKITEIASFSFAIDSNKDRSDVDFLPSVFRDTGDISFKFQEWNTFDLKKQWCKEIHGEQINSEWEFNDIAGWKGGKTKENLFSFFVFNQGIADEWVLFDDMVIESTFTDEETGQTIRFINIQS